MAIQRAAVLTTITLVTVLSTVGCANSAAVVEGQSNYSAAVEEASTPITAPSDVKLTFATSGVTTIPAPAPEFAPVRKTDNRPVPAVVSEPQPALAAPASKEPAAVTIPAPKSELVAPPAPVVETRYVYVGLAGGQDVVDLERGPVLFPLPAGFPPYIAEHDIAGGWARFGTLKAGMKVTISGLVNGTYTVGQIITVPKRGSTDEFHAFAATPKVMLQTCIPGTNRMIVVGLY